MFDGKKCKLCKECVLIVREEKMQEIDNQASISEADMETSVAAAPSSESDAPSALGTASKDVNSSVPEPDDCSDTPLPGTDPEPALNSHINPLLISHGVRRRFRNHGSQHEWCAVEVPELRR